MYNDENNLYHYSYRRDGDGPTLGQQLYHQETGRTVKELKPVKKNRIGLKITVLALVCALIGGAVGSGGMYWAMARFNGAGQNESLIAGEPAASDRDEAPTLNEGGVPASTVKLQTVDGVTALTDAEVYAANVNSVVSINTTGTSGYNIFNQPVQSASAGSGFILTADGFIATNYHVIDGANKVTVTLYGGESYEARIVSGEEDYDVAVLKIDAENLQPVSIGDSTLLNVGDHVLAVGNPLGELTFSMTGGMVSCVNRAINVDGTPFNMIQTDASINPGNSGGPMFNQYGQVVGIVTAKYSSTSSGENAEGLGFAIPINDVFAIIKDIMTNGYVANRPYLGITPISMTEQMAAQYHYSISKGVFISYVEEGTAADKAGLRVNDVITKVDNTEIATYDDLVLAKRSYSAGDTATLTVYRQGEILTVRITWGAAPVEENAQAETGNNQQDNGQYGNGYYMNPNDLFNYFFGNRYW